MPYIDKIEMQQRLFGELSAMFATEVPLYDKSLLVNRVTNRAICDLMGKLHRGFHISDEAMELASGERHGAIRIGREDEYHWIGRFFAAFAMEPHGFYDMSNVGAKSQPIVATAFRSRHNPEHRVFTSLLIGDYFDPATKARIDALLSSREVVSTRARQLIERGERQGGLDRDDAEALVREGTERIFKWTGMARDHEFYQQLCNDGLKIVADIVCFESHHLNHLTPNTFCMSLFTSAMKFCLGELDAATLRARATTALTSSNLADKDWLRLCFRHLSPRVVDACAPGEATDAEIGAIVDGLVERLGQPDLDFSRLQHSGFKDSTEGPSGDTPILLRQDAYKALTEPVRFRNADGSTVDGAHTARFGEIEQRFYATTVAGRKLYDLCLAAAEADLAADPSLAKRDLPAYEARHATHFAAFPKTLAGLLEARLVHGLYSPTANGLAARGTIATRDIDELVRLGYARVEGLRYEDFLPVSAAGIFASNLNQYGTRPTAVDRPVFTQARLEQILGRRIVDPDVAYRKASENSIRATLDALGIPMHEQVPA
jgi:uncharacterized glyoxalase superfamily metalloenzyme YdcJ